MYSFQANVGSRGYHVYKNTEWKPTFVNQLMTIEVRFLFLPVGGAPGGVLYYKVPLHTKHKASLFPSDFEITCLLNFTQICKEILDKMKRFVVSNLSSKTKGSWFCSRC